MPRLPTGRTGWFDAPSIAELGAAIVSELRGGWNGEDPAPVALGAIPFAPGEVVLAVPVPGRAPNRGRARPG